MVNHWKQCLAAEETSMFNILMQEESCYITEIVKSLQMENGIRV